MDPTVQSFSYKITSKKYKFELRKCNFLVHFNFTPTDLLIGGGVLTGMGSVVGLKKLQLGGVS